MKDFQGNSRLLYLKQPNSKIDISAALSVIDKHIINSKNLNFSSSDIILEFFQNPCSEGFSEGSASIGRLITGFEQQVFDELNFKDYTQRKTKAVELVSIESWEQLFDKAQKIVPLNNDKWTVYVSDDFSDIQVSFVDASH